METPVKYEVDKPIYPNNKRQEVLRSPYFQSVSSTADSIIMCVGLTENPEQHEAIISRAIAFTDMLIEKVGQKM